MLCPSSCVKVHPPQALSVNPKGAENKSNAAPIVGRRVRDEMQEISPDSVPQPVDLVHVAVVWR